MNRRKNAMTTSESFKIIATPLIAVLIVFLGFGIFGQWHLGQLAVEKHNTTTKNDALRIAKTVERQIAELENYNFQDLVLEIAELMGSRVTIIRKDGQVLADSNLNAKSVKLLDNHSTRPEIKQAWDEGVGISTRVSKMTGKSLLYVAVPFHSRKIAGIIRIAHSLADLQEQTKQQRFEFLILELLSIVFADIIGTFAFKNLGSRINSQKQKLEHRVRERTQDVQRLQNLGTLLSACNTTDETTEIIEQIVPDILPNVSGALSIFKASRNALDVTSSWGEKWKGEFHYLPTECWSLRTGRAHPSVQGQVTVKCSHLPANDDAYTLCIPMTAHGEVMGALHLSKERIKITTDEREITSILAEQISLAIANIKLRQSLKDQAIRDSLTGLYNRRFLIEFLEKEILRTQRNNSQVTVMMLDVDHFKKFNDSFGHDAGDMVLAKVGETLQNTIRSHDVACRYGGEEFTIILPRVSLVEAKNMATRLGDAIRSLKITHASQRLSTITMSIGIAIFPDHGEKPEELIKAADEALYLAKNNGRDRFEVKLGTKAILANIKDKDVC
ncbi:MAG: diguanylate cyclase [Sneathiella sp.]|nr:diguanylate cyclase [Sneathiella sp.]